MISKSVQRTRLYRLDEETLSAIASTRLVVMRIEIREQLAWANYIKIGWHWVSDETGARQFGQPFADLTMSSRQALQNT